MLKQTGQPPFIPFREHDYLHGLEVCFYCWKYHSFRTKKVQFTKSYLFCSSLVPLKYKLPAVPGSELDVEDSWGECREEPDSKKAAQGESIWRWGIVTPATGNHTQGDTSQHLHSQPFHGDQLFSLRTSFRTSVSIQTFLPIRCWINCRNRKCLRKFPLGNACWLSKQRHSIM